MKKILLFLPVVVFALAQACKNPRQHSEPDGGPCSYEDHRVGARIISLEALDSNSYDAVLVLDSNEYIGPPYDTLNVYMELGRYLTKAEVDSLGLKKGKALVYEMKRIITGSCNPEINILLVETMQ